MPQLELSEMECKALWLILDATAPEMVLPTALLDAERTLFDKSYRAYRGMPMREATA